jgi:hypothetical protein
MREERERRPYSQRPPIRQRGSESNTIWVRADEKSYFYINLTKKLFHFGKHEEIELHAAGKESIYTAFRTVELLTRVGYAEVSSMKTSQLKKRDEDDRVISKVQIVLKKLP